MSKRLSGAPPELGPEALDQLERDLREERRNARAAAGGIEEEVFR